MSQSAPQWKEVYLGGSEAAERAMIERFSHDILAVQNRVAAAVGKQRDRTFHAKMILGVENALFTVDPTLPQDLAAGYFNRRASSVQACASRTRHPCIKAMSQPICGAPPCGCASAMRIITTS